MYRTNAQSRALEDAFVRLQRALPAGRRHAVLRAAKRSRTCWPYLRLIAQPVRQREPSRGRSTTCRAAGHRRQDARRPGARGPRSWRADVHRPASWLDRGRRGDRGATAGRRHARPAGQPPRCPLLAHARRLHRRARGAQPARSARQGAGRHRATGSSCKTAPRRATTAGRTSMELRTSADNYDDMPPPTAWPASWKTRP